MSGSYVKNLRNLYTYNIDSIMATGTNLGSGVGVYASTSGSTLQFKSLISGSGIQISATGSEITIAAGGTDVALFPAGITVGGVTQLTGIRYNVATNSSTSISLAGSDDIVICTGSAAQVITLPAAASCSGQAYHIINRNTSGANPPLVINTSGSDVIIGFGSSLNLTTTGDNINLISDGITSWIPI
jgi:hypothetical protein